ncbi:kinase-like domain-containing protein [Xylogone sp. PMI_703]|nr:kinase-like domain-containing protein [Xylogone sp. PMI_703]
MVDYYPIMSNLKLQLQDALHKSPGHKDPFLPDDKLGEIIQAELVRGYLLAHPREKLRKNCLEIVDYVCGSRLNARGLSRRIFAILLIIDKPALILDFLREGIDDGDLPLLKITLDGEEYILARKVGDISQPIEAFRQWSYAKRLAFYNTQWRVQLPVFLKGKRSIKYHPVHRLNSEAVLPWTDYEQTYDGNSEVIRVKIHCAHHRFDAEHQSFALKSLKPLEGLDNDIGFHLEVKALIKVKPRRHLEVDLLTTFEYKERYHMLFRWADGGNLYDYWKNHDPSSVVNYEWVCWFAEQCQGLAYGLDGIHNTKMTLEEAEAIQLSPISPSFAQDFAGTSPRSPPDEDDGKDFGRHGDIKPQNILWFEHDKNSYGLGVLKLSDFGLTTFHRALSTKITPVGVRVTPTYSAPERETKGKLSRPFDIWSLGCIYLEFVTWILLGIEGLGSFSDERAAETGYRDGKFFLDNFYMLVKEDGQAHAQVKSSVCKWISYLKKKQKCSRFLSEFLNYIQTKMLLVDKDGRDKSKDVSEQLKKMFLKCKLDPSYAGYSATGLDLAGDDRGIKRKRTAAAGSSSRVDHNDAQYDPQEQPKRTRQEATSSRQQF